MKRESKQSDKMKDIAALCKRRGIIFPGSEIYGGMANTWDYGPYGVLLKNNVKQIWWEDMVMKRADIVGLDSGILMNPEVWKASGHSKKFTDSLLECKKCKRRYKFPDDFPGIKAHKDKDGDWESSGKPSAYRCPNCDAIIDSTVRTFNLMFKTNVGSVDTDDGNIAYLRPETAQGIFVNFKNVLDSMRVKLPFGIAQIGKAFRNEITPGNFIFRTLEFEQFELEYFVYEKNADEVFKQWVKDRLQWYIDLGIDKKRIKLVNHSRSDLAHYAKAVTDIEYEFPFGWSELEGIANRGDYDLKQHAKHSGEGMVYSDDGKKVMPHIIEPSGGVDRAVLAFLVDSYSEEEIKGEKRTVLSLHPKLAPIKVAILPLVKKEPLIKKAREIYEGLKDKFFVEYDESGTIGKRYRRQDEIGTPFCITVDFENLEKDKVTIRHRDSMKQDIVAIKKIGAWLEENLS